MSLKKENRLVVVLLLALVVLVPTASYVGYQYAVYAGAISSPGITYGPGDVDAYSYTIFKEGSTYYAKNGTTRAIDYSGTNFATVFNSLITENQLNIQLRSGIFYVTSTLVLDYSVRVSGAGSNSTILQLDADVNLFNVTSRYVEISDFWLEGNRKDGIGVYIDGYADALNFKVQRNRIQHFLNYAIFVDGEPANGYIFQNRIIENWGGILISSSSDNIISQNDIGALSDSSGISLSGSGNNLIVDNFVYMAGYNYSTSLYGLAWPGIQIYGAHFDMLANNRVAHNGGEGIQIYNSTYITVSFGSIYSNNQAADSRGGIIILGNSTLNKITGVQIWDWQTPSTQDYGIREYEQADYNTVVAVSAFNATVSDIALNGTNTHAAGCWNGTNWLLAWP